MNSVSPPWGVIDWEANQWIFYLSAPPPDIWLATTSLVMPINKNASPRVGEWCYLEKKGNVWNPISNKSYTCKRSVINFDVPSRVCLPFSLCRWNKLKFCQRCLCFFEGAVLVCWPQHKQTEIAACRRFNFKYSTHILAFFIAIPQRPFSFELHQNC